MSWWIMTMITIKISSLKGRHLEYTIHILLYCTYDICEVVRIQQGMNRQQRSNASRYSCLRLRCLWLIFDGFADLLNFAAPAICENLINALCASGGKFLLRFETTAASASSSD